MTIVFKLLRTTHSLLLYFLSSYQQESDIVKSCPVLLGDDRVDRRHEPLVQSMKIHLFGWKRSWFKVTESRISNSMSSNATPEQRTPSLLYRSSVTWREIKCSRSHTQTSSLLCARHWHLASDGLTVGKNGIQTKHLRRTSLQLSTSFN